VGSEPRQEATLTRPLGSENPPVPIAMRPVPQDPAPYRLVNP